VIGKKTRMEDDYSEYNNGPEQIIPVNNYITWKPSGAVKIRMGTDGVGSMPPQSVPGILAQNAKEIPNHPAIKARDAKKAELTWTWNDYHQEVRTIAKAFIDLGLGRFESVCILGFNSPEWIIADMAGIFAGGFATGIYPTNGPEACRYILEHSKCAILVVEDQKQLDKIWEFRNELPDLKRIVQYSGVPNNPGVLSWKDVLNRGKGLGEEDLERRLKRIAINQCCTLVYTSGTTGNPKGVMLSHDNVVYEGKAVVQLHKFPKGGRVLSYLPLSHIAGQMVDIYAMLALGGTTYCADNKVMKGTLPDNLNWCKPTMFLGVPRVWEKIMEGMLAKGRDIKGLKKTISTKAKEAGLKHHKEGGNDFEFKLYNKLVFSKVKGVLGFDECIAFITGAAPMEKKTMDYFLSLDIQILEAYGMSETTGAHTFVTNDTFADKIKADQAVGGNSCGKAVAPFKTKLVRPGNDDITADKELCMWGRHVMMGYKDREDATKKEMSEDGWMKSGDLARVDSQGFHFIVGRDKDLIITAGGENIAPNPIQEEIKKELPCISQALLLGDKQKFVSVFLTLLTDVDLETMEPTSNLTGSTKDWCRSVGSQANTVMDVLNGPDRNVMSAIQRGIDKVNARAVSNAQRVQKWTVIPNDFSLPGGELGPTMKVKRNEVTKKYKNCIENIYCTPIMNGR
jgi:long-chain-fatty-acid--CoA ligase ACSBG